MSLKVRSSANVLQDCVKKKRTGLCMCIQSCETDHQGSTED